MPRQGKLPASFCESESSILISLRIVQLERCHHLQILVKSASGYPAWRRSCVLAGLSLLIWGVAIAPAGAESNLTTLPSDERVQVDGTENGAGNSGPDLFLHPRLQFQSISAAAGPTISSETRFSFQRSGLDLPAMIHGLAVTGEPVFRSSSSLLPQSVSTGDDLELVAQHPTNAVAVDEDSDLGVLRLQGKPLPELTTQAPTAEPEPDKTEPTADVCDTELGCLRLQVPTPAAAPRQPVLYLLTRLDYFRSDNIFSSAVDPIGDNLFRPGLTLFATPYLGQGFYLVGSVNGNLVRYTDQFPFNYDDLLVRAGIYKVLSPNMSGEIGWSFQQLFIASDDLLGLSRGTRFLGDHAFRIDLNRRDQLSKKLSLNSYYQFRLGFADPADRSRVNNSLILSLNYDLQPNLQAGVDYLFSLSNFTQVKRQDLYNQISARLTYTPIQNTQLNIYAGYSFGGSTENNINFDGFVFGASLNFSWALF